MPITRVTAMWSGFPGAPGYSNFYFAAFGGGDQVNVEVAKVRAFFDDIKGLLPSVVTMTVAQEAAILDEATGDLIGYAAADTAPAVVVGAQAGIYSAPSGAAITWQTGTVAKGRRLRGRTFIVPLAGNQYDLTGTLASTCIGTLNTAATTLRTATTGPQLVVWSRPGASGGGVIGPVTGSRVADKSAVLRSRRD